MSTIAISSLSASWLQQVLASAVQAAGLTGNSASTSGTGRAASPAQSDSSQLSPFAQLASTLQQLQQSDPARYKQVTAQIAANLLGAAETAQSQGNSGAASQLTRLANDFSSASSSGQLPNLQDLAQAVGGSGHGHHHHRHVQENSDSGSTATSDSSGNASHTVSQFLALLQATDPSTQNASLDPGAIIQKTLSDAGINHSNS